MRINWKLRLKNKVTLSSLIALAVAFIYQILAMFGIIPKVPMTEVLDAISVLLEILAGLGIIVDPTTKGLHDSDMAMEYEVPSVGTLDGKPELPDDFFEQEPEDGGEQDGE